MLAYMTPVLFALFLWWISTGAIMYLVRVGATRIAWLLTGAGVMLALSLYGVAVSSAQATVTGAYLAFTGAVLIWGALEAVFLSGTVTGPWRRPCPEGAEGWRRAFHATAAILYHELSLIAACAVIAVVTWGGVNQVALGTFLLLWVMRVSAKLNLFLGVPFVNAEFLPHPLRFLASYFRIRSMNPLFPFSITASTVVAVLLIQQSLAPDAGPFVVTGLALLGALMALAIIEHWFMVLPLPVIALWRWGLNESASRSTASIGRSLDGLPQPQPVVPLRSVQPTPPHSRQPRQP